MRRWAIRFIIGGMIVLILLVVAIQLVLMSDLPRTWILRAASQETGLTIAADSLSVGWLGHTTLHGVDVVAPLSEERVLSIESVDLSHRSLPLLLITRSLGLEQVGVQSPELFLRQDAHGRWNIQDVIARLTARSEPDVQGPPNVALPAVEVRDGYIHVAEPNETTLTIGPVRLSGSKRTRSAWQFNLKVDQGIDVQGQVAPGGNWAQGIDFDIEPNEALIRRLLPGQAGPIRVSGNWSGRIEGSGVTGTLRLDRFRAGPAAAFGTVGVVVNSDGLTLGPDGVTVIEPNLAGRKVRFTSGRVAVDRDGVRADQLTLTAEMLVSQMTGRWAFGTQQGQASVRWTGSLPEGGGLLSGTSEFSIDSPPLGRKELKVAVTLSGRSSLGELHLSTEIRGAGLSWQESLWEVSVGKLLWIDAEREIDLGGAAATVAVDWPQIELASVTLPETAQTQATAQVNAQTLDWTVQIAAQGCERLAGPDSQLDIQLDASGDRNEVVIHELTIAEGNRTAVATGTLEVASGRIREAHVSAKWSAPKDPANVTQAAEETGQWICELDVKGTTQPIDLEFDGTIAGRSVRLAQRKVARLEIPLQGRVNPEQVQISTESFDLLKGRWRLRGQHNLSEPLTRLQLSIDDLSLQAAAELAGSPLNCQGLARAKLQVAVPDFTLERAQAYGTWEVNDLSIPPFEAEYGRGRLRIEQGRARFDEILLGQGQGKAQGTMQFRLDQPQRLFVQFNMAAWPLEWEPQEATVLLDSDADVTLDIAEKSLDGQARLAGRLLLAEQTVGHLNMSVRLRQRTLDLYEVEGELLGGQIDGFAEVPLDRWVQSTAQLQWQGIEPNQLAPWWPVAEKFAGQLSGTLTAGVEETGSRALEPMLLELHTKILGGRFGQVRLEDGHLLAYLGRDRFLIDRMDVHAMDGLIRGWARVSPHEGGLYMATVIDINDIDLDELAQATEPNESGPVIGRLSGRTTLMTSSDWRHLSGQATLNLSQSDLANLPVLQTLYNALNLNLGQARPEGTGQLQLQFDGTRIRIPSFVYFNRGVEVRGAGQIDDFTQGQQSSVDGYAVGSTRVLKGLRLPGVRELDRLMASLQSGVASVTVGGTIDALDVAVVPLPVVSSPLRRLLWSQLRDEQE